jgi:hypothetical protein
MSRTIQRLGNLPSAGKFVFESLFGPGQLKFHDQAQLKVVAKLEWHAGKGVRITCSQKRKTISEFPNRKSTASLEVHIEAGPWKGWKVIGCKLQYSGGRQRLASDGSTVFELSVVQGPTENVRLVAPMFTGESCGSDVLRYWIPNFFFEPLIETSSFRKVSKPDGFRFKHADNEFTFRLVPDHELVREAYRLRDIFSAVSSVLEVRGPLCAEKEVWNDTIGCLGSLVSGIEGSWMMPVAVARYAGKGQLQEIVFRSERASPYVPHRSFMDNHRVADGWPKFLETALP